MRYYWSTCSQLQTDTPEACSPRRYTGRVLRRLPYFDLRSTGVVLQACVSPHSGEAHRLPIVVQKKYCELISKIIAGLS